jgi:hypothetical protein
MHANYPLPAQLGCWFSRKKWQATQKPMKNFWEQRHLLAKINLGDHAGPEKRGVGRREFMREQQGRIERGKARGREAMVSCGRSAKMSSEGGTIARGMK